MTINKNRGYTLLFAILTATLVLGVAVFITSVSKKQYELSVTARDSMYAFYAADSAMECLANFYDQNAVVFEDEPEVLFNCQENTVSGQYLGWSDSSPDTSIWPSFVLVAQDILVPLAEGSCAIASIIHGEDADGGITTRLIARGYNICASGGPSESTRTVERAVQMTYR